MVRHISKYIVIQVLALLLIAAALSSVKLKGVRLWTYLNENVISEGGQAKLMFNDLQHFKPNDESVFVMGSSHAYRGYDPRIFGASGFQLFNMGTSGQNMKDTYSLLKANKDKIERLVVDVYPGVLQNVTEESTLMLIQNADNNATALTILKNNITINSLNNEAARLLDMNPKPLPYAEKYIANGYVEKDSRFKSDTSLTYPAFQAGSNFPYLDSVLVFAVRHHIRTCLASHPLKWNNAYKAYYTSSYLPALQSVISKYPQVPFFDYTLAHPNQDSLFSDANHLNQSGVNWYNARLTEDLKQAWKSPE